MSWIPASWRADKNAKKKETPKKPHWEKKIKLPTEMRSDKVRWKFYCPNLCQQKKNGSKGKKTFDGKECKACGYKKKE